MIDKVGIKIDHKHTVFIQIGDTLPSIRRVKADGLQDRVLLVYTFDKADNSNPAIKYAHRYVLSAVPFCLFAHF